jgi:hypothetical protein
MDSMSVNYVKRHHWCTYELFSFFPFLKKIISILFGEGGGGVVVWGGY